MLTWVKSQDDVICVFPATPASTTVWGITVSVSSLADTPPVIFGPPAHFRTCSTYFWSPRGIAPVIRKVFFGSIVWHGHWWPLLQWRGWGFWSGHCQHFLQDGLLLYSVMLIEFRFVFQISLLFTMLPALFPSHPLVWSEWSPNRPFKQANTMKLEKVVSWIFERLCTNSVLFFLKKRSGSMLQTELCQLYFQCDHT